MGIFELKTDAEIRIMHEGGKKLSKIKEALLEQIRVGKNANDVENLADILIQKAGGKPSFKMVPGYRWATCVNVNAGLVHGIPCKEVVFKEGDIVSVDLGILYKGFHADSSFSEGIGLDKEMQKFLDVGKAALQNAIKKCVSGGRIYDISGAIEKTVKAAEYEPIRALVGHGIGRNLHEDPQIPCFVPGDRKESMRIEKGMVLAIEVMYAKGKPDVYLDKDGWTISMRDGKMSGLFEETVAVTKNGPLCTTT